jgi:hypothetical protein
MRSLGFSWTSLSPKRFGTGRAGFEPAPERIRRRPGPAGSSCRRATAAARSGRSVRGPVGGPVRGRFAGGSGRRKCAAAPGAAGRERRFRPVERVGNLFQINALNLDPVKIWRAQETCNKGFDRRKRPAYITAPQRAGGQRHAALLLVSGARNGIRGGCLTSELRERKGCAGSGVCDVLSVRRS